MRGTLLGLAFVCALACKKVEQPAPDAGPLPAVLGPAPTVVTQIDLWQCHGCPYCDGAGRLIDRSDARHSRVTDCLVKTNLQAHGMALSSGERLLLGPSGASPFFRLATSKPLRLKLPPETTVFGLSTVALRPASCQLRVTARPDTPTEQTARFALRETLHQAYVGAVGGRPLEDLELEASCSGELGISAMWYAPERAPEWPALPDEPSIKLEALPEPTGTNGPELLWAPPVALERHADGDMTTLSLAVLNLPLIRNQLGLSTQDFFEVEEAGAYWVRLGRRFSWADQRAAVLGDLVTVELVAGNRLRSIKYQLGPRPPIPKRTPLSEAAVLRLRGYTGKELDKPPWLAFRDGRLVYVHSTGCYDNYADAFTGKYLGRHMPLCKN